jgi:hypothetical protein
VLSSPLLAACVESSSTTEAVALGSIRGTVSAPGGGVAGATMALSGPAVDTVSTAAEGSFAFVDLSPGTYTLTLANVSPLLSFATLQRTVSVSMSEVSVDFDGAYFPLTIAHDPIGSGVVGVSFAADLHATGGDGSL